VRLFAAVWPDDATAQRLSSLRLGTSDRLRLVGPGNWHITLRFLAEVDDDLVPMVVEALRSAARTLAGPVRCDLGPSTAWFGDRVLQIPVGGVDDLAAAVRSATAPVVPEPTRGAPPFNGHLTIARSRGRRLARSVRDAVAGIPFAATFDVDRVDLVASQLNAEGRRYTTVATVPLLG
jgi:2'-5' RNA ligase